MWNFCKAQDQKLRGLNFKQMKIKTLKLEKKENWKTPNGEQRAVHHVMNKRFIAVDI